MTSEAIRWRDWSKSAFDEAASQQKLVLLDLSASWCHWCHVMDDTTYSNKEIVDAINRSFIPVRVDIDRRPDISDRYNRGGFPTTAFLSDRGESIWGATYVPPDDMRRIIKSILDAKASGEIDAALERERMQYLDLSKAVEEKRPVGPHEVESIFEDIFSAYDVDSGGFGTQPKFPHPDVLDMLLLQYSRNKDGELSEAVVHTLDRMTEGLYDHTEGGVYRYSVTGDWKTPHYEKMLDTNTGYLRNLVRAGHILDKKRFIDQAHDEGQFMLRTLWNPGEGGFSASQDADEIYYKLPRDERQRLRSPPVDRRIFAGWNADAASTMIEAGALLQDQRWLEVGKKAWEYNAKKLWNPKIGLVSHLREENHFLFDDQVSFLESTLAVLGLSSDDRPLELAMRLVRGVESAFAHPEGGFADILVSKEAVGELENQKRPLVENSRWAMATARLGIATHDLSLIDRARKVLHSFSLDDVEAHGLFGSQYVIASWVLESGPLLVEIHGADGKNLSSDCLWNAAKRALHPGVVLRTGNYEDKVHFATICRTTECSKPFSEPAELFEKLRTAWASQG